MKIFSGLGRGLNKYSSCARAYHYCAGLIFSLIINWARLAQPDKIGQAQIASSSLNRTKEFFKSKFIKDEWYLGYLAFTSIK